MHNGSNCVHHFALSLKLLPTVLRYFVLGGGCTFEKLHCTVFTPIGQLSNSSPLKEIKHVLYRNFPENL